MDDAPAPGRAFCLAFARRPLQAMANRSSFERGLEYANVGRVGRLISTSTSALATVRGAQPYQVKLALKAGQPTFDCSCPIGADGRFCKHAVAVALVATGLVTQKADPDGEIDLRAYLSGLEHGALVELLADRAEQDGLFDARLRMQAARTTSESPSLGVFRNALDGAFQFDDYVDYRDMFTYASNIESTLDSLQGLLDDGHGTEVMALVEHAVDLAEGALGYVDDSDGYMSGIAERLRELHVSACVVAHPDPVALARDLFAREGDMGDLEVFYGALRTYSEVLGAAGIAEYRRLAETEWNRLPALGVKDEDRSWSSHRSHITQIMETLAELSGDVDARVEVLARDQSSTYQFVRIAEVYRNAERYEEALAWAEKGLALFGRSDSRLMDAAAEEYHRAGRSAEAVSLAWAAYEDLPGVVTYQQLQQQATRADVWTDWHDKAIQLLRRRIESRPKQPAGRWPQPGPDSSTLVEVCLLDGDVEAAWAQAQKQGCRNQLWLELARLRETEHPLESIPIWQQEIERQIDVKKNHAYDRAVELIARVRGLMISADREKDLLPYLATLRAEHKPKRNLMKLFNARGW
jgi:uncharacterized Zn finger protein